MSGHRRARSLMPTVLMLSGIVLLATGLFVLWRIHAYKQHARTAAAYLVRSERARAVDVQHDSAAVGCRAPLPSDPRAGAARAVLEIPSLGVTAPVLAGTGNAQLDRGVGHLTASAWPDQAGVVVLEAHDVTFFSALDKLAPGARLTIDAPCHTWSYAVHRTDVVAKGSPIPATAPGLVLVTCWPTNALYYTSHRFVVTADLVSVAGGPPGATPAAAALPVVRPSLPSALASQDLSLDRVRLPVGTLTEAPTIAADVRQSGSALAAADAVERLMVASLLTASEQRQAWWSALAPTVPYSNLGPLRGALPARWQSSVNLSLQGSGQTITGASASGTAWLPEVGATRLYRITMTASIADNRMRIDTWSVQPVTA